MSKKKYYVVWKGYNPGVYDSWNDCKKQINGYQDAVYKSFTDLKSANAAFNEDYKMHVGKDAAGKKVDKELLKRVGLPIMESISVDAACNTVNKKMEYQGVKTKTGELIFRQGPFEGGSNNIGEFLAIVHALAHCTKKNIGLPIYTDSITAMKWVSQKHANTKVVEESHNKELFDLVKRAEKWLKENSWKNKLLKWETAVWGEIPADFGRK